METVMMFLIICLAGYAFAFSCICIYDEISKLIKEAWRLNREIYEANEEIKKIRTRAGYRSYKRKIKRHSFF